MSDYQYSTIDTRGQPVPDQHLQPVQILRTKPTPSSFPISLRWDGRGTRPYLVGVGFRDRRYFNLREAERAYRAKVAAPPFRHPVNCRCTVEEPVA